MNAINRTFEVDPAMEDPYAVFTEPGTITLRRRLSGPIDRVWAYLTQSKLRRQWLASGEMPMQVSARFDLTWRNDELTVPSGQRPDGFPGVHTSQNQIVAFDPNRVLAFSFGTYGEVTFEIEPRDSDVTLTLVHRGLNDRSILLVVGPSWHNHLDLLAARLLNSDSGDAYWDKMARLHAEYQVRLPA